SVESPAGCIFVRRHLSFVEHRTLTVPLIAYANCIGVPCDDRTTCSALGQCVSAEIDPTTCKGGGCFLSGEQAPRTLLRVGPGGGFVGGDGGLVGVQGGAATAGNIVSAGFMACFRFPSRRLKCWGDNVVGQLGLGDTNNRGGFPGQMGN